MWQNWVNALLGLWVIAVPFVGITGNALAWTLAITGVAVAVLALWGMQDSSSMEHEARGMAHHA